MGRKIDWKKRIREACVSETEKEQRRKKREKAEKWKQFKELLVKYFWLLFILLFILYFVIEAKMMLYHKSLLQEGGQCTKAYVYRGRHFNRYGRSHFTHYEFEVDGKRYTGRGNSDHKVGDSIVILYLLSDPSINMDQSIINIDCP